MLDSRTLSRWTAAIGLVAAPVLFGASFAIQKAWSDDAATYLAEVASSTTRHALWAGLFALGCVALLAGMLGTSRLLRGRRGAVGQAGALAVGLAAALMGGLVLAISVAELAMVDRAADAAEMAALYDRTEEVTFAMVIFGVIWGGLFMLGMLVLAVGLVLRRVVPLWSPLLLVAWLAGMAALDGPFGSLVTSLLFLGAVAPIAYRIASLSDEEWARWQPLPAAAVRSRASAGRVGADAAA